MKMFYFTDAMCSWCFGFSPVIKKLKENYPDIDLEIVSGGFSPGSKQVVDPEYRDFLEYHWRNVNERSGQYFDHAMKFVSDTFTYDTEPASRALIVVQKLAAKKDYEFLNLMQKSFYSEGKDITDENVLGELAKEIGIDKIVFLENFNSDESKLKTQQGFQFSKQLGVRGFPTLLTLENGNVKLISHGFQSYDTLKPAIEDWLETAKVSEVKAGQSCNDTSCGC
ncbi:DsbA family protein [Flavobacterium sp. 17A]|uniref:DsbA family protein n=1 Tax=Flavobacterium potami TaxID=2872310 RepID=A0A9X1HE62_9FLAO|nr:DsbA family protein [Flavobacterium potami]MBZ4037496.1 DsbA family protein [Flavobacterium potami]